MVVSVSFLGAFSVLNSFSFQIWEYFIDLHYFFREVGAEKNIPWSFQFGGGGWDSEGEVSGMGIQDHVPDVGLGLSGTEGVWVLTWSL